MLHRPNYAGGRSAVSVRRRNPHETRVDLADGIEPATKHLTDRGTGMHSHSKTTFDLRSFVAAADDRDRALEHSHFLLDAARVGYDGGCVPKQRQHVRIVQWLCKT